jgi:hypothetical protein
VIDVASPQTISFHQESKVTRALQPAALDQLFLTARTYGEWTDEAVDESVVRELYDLLKWGPTSVIAARALGLDCGPMSGFDNAGVDKVFFAGTRIQSNFICCLGHGKPGSAAPRNPRLTFEEAGRFA